MGPFLLAQQTLRGTSEGGEYTETETSKALLKPGCISHICNTVLICYLILIYLSPYIFCSSGAALRLWPICACCKRNALRKGERSNGRKRDAINTHRARRTTTRAASRNQRTTTPPSSSRQSQRTPRRRSRRQKAGLYFASHDIIVIHERKTDLESSRAP